MTQPFDPQNQRAPLPQGQAMPYQSMRVPPRPRLGFVWTFLIGIATYIVLALAIIGGSAAMMKPGGGVYVPIIGMTLYVLLLIGAGFLRWWGFIAAMLLMIPVTFLLWLAACFALIRGLSGPPPSTAARSTPPAHSTH